MTLALGCVQMFICGNKKFFSLGNRFVIFINKLLRLKPTHRRRQAFDPKMTCKIFLLRFRVFPS